jgi:hypothetical protein
MTDKRLIPYPEARALEDAMYMQEATPTLLLPLLLPVWRVAIKASITEGEPYELVDHYLERGIAHGGLDTPAALARFFSLEEVLVDRALRFLVAIGHLTRDGDRVKLTSLGRQSVRDGVRYVINREDRRKLYFDAFNSLPLPRAYYDSSTVTLLGGTELRDLEDSRGGEAFKMLPSLRGFRTEALAELAGQADRDHFNLPERIDNPQIIGAPEGVFLPVYVVRTAGSNGRPRCLCYTQAGDTADDDIGKMCNRSDEIVGAVENEHIAQKDRDEARANEWLGRRNLEHLRPIRLRNGLLRVTFPAATFAADNGALAISKVGSFVVQGNHFFQVWCDDERLRRRALLERTDSYLGARTRIDRGDIAKRIGLFGRQLGLGQIDLSTVRQMASRAGKHNLAAQLGRVE